MPATARLAVVLSSLLILGCHVVSGDAALRDGADDWVPSLEPPGGESADMDLLTLTSSAAEALTSGDPRTALGLLERAAARAQPDATARFLAGVAHLQLGDLDASRAELEASLALDPADNATRCVLARVCEEQGDLDAAVAQMQQAIALDAGQARLHTLLGHLYLEQQDLPAALKTLLRAIDLDPEDVDAHRGLAVLFLRADEPASAEQAFRRALRLDPADALLQAGRGNALRDLGRLDEALACYREASRLEPDDPVHHANEASALVSLGRPGEARDAFERALALPLPPGTRAAIIHYDYATLLQRLGDVNSACDELLFALEADPAFWAAHERLGLLYLDRGRQALAVQHLEEALDLQGLGPEAMLRLTLAHEARGEADAARECARLLAGADQGDPEIAFRHAQLLVQSSDAEIRDPAQAVAIVRKLLDDGAGDDGALWNLMGQALARQGSYEEAVAAADRALQAAEPGDPVRKVYSDRRDQYLARLANR